MISTRRGFVCSVLYGAAGLASAADVQKAWLAVKVNYTGPGPVDAGHKIFVAMWDTSDFTKKPGLRPLEVKSVQANGQAVQFEGIKKNPVFISLVYDPAGKWNANTDPPAGAVLGLYMSEPGIPAPIQLKPGQTTKLAVSFDDSSKQK